MNLAHSAGALTQADLRATRGNSLLAFDLTHEDMDKLKQMGGGVILSCEPMDGCTYHWRSRPFMYASILTCIHSI
jgi:hypothetical protein